MRRLDKSEAKFRWGILFLVVYLVGFGCQSENLQSREVIFATTTSLQDSGLLDTLIPFFEKESGYRVKTIAVGSGQALSMGARGEVDLILTHDPEAEKKFMAEGYGINRRLVMHNDFVLVGPKKDPAQIRGVKSISEALRLISFTKSFFVSRGDNSGTHTLEKRLWGVAKINPKGKTWYLEAGQGMGQTLNIANEKDGYTLSDRATYLTLKKRLSLEIFVQGEKSLLNPYHIIEINSQKWPQVNSQGAKILADFLLSKDAQALIGEFGREKFGVTLFIPDAGKKEENL